MKVGVYLDDYVPQDGGAYTFQFEVVSSLRKLAAESRHKFVLISAGKAEESKAENGLKVILCPSPGLAEKISGFFVRTWPGLRAAWKWQSSLERRARRSGLEFIWFLSPRGREIDLPFMTIVLDLQHRLQPWFPEVSAFGEWEVRERHYSMHLRRATAIIAGTEAGKQEIVRFYQIPEERIHILPHPTPSYALAESVPGDENILTRLGLEPGYIFYPAQFWAHKNHVNLLIALKHLRDSGVKKQLVLTGADFGNKQFVTSQIQELGLEDQVHILGFAQPEDMAALYRGAFALTYVSLFGPENLPPLEAFALGCPVIAANVSGAEEQMDGAALLVDPTSPEQIAAAISRVLEDEHLRENLIARGRKRAEQWKVDDFVRGAFGVIDSFETVRHVWD